MRTQLFVMAAFVTLAAACDSSRQGGIGESRASAEGDVPVEETTTGGGDSCMTETCFDLSSVDNAISFVAIDGLACDGGELELSLFDADGEAINIDPVLQGNGSSCEGLASTAQKFELRGEMHAVTLCVSGAVGDVTLAVKASTSCELTTVAGTCDCDDTDGTGGGGTGGSDTTGTGTGGSDTVGTGTGGSDTVGTGTGGDDDDGGEDDDDGGDDDDDDDDGGNDDDGGDDDDDDGGGDDTSVGVTTGGSDVGTGGSDGGTGGSDGGTGGEGGCPEKTDGGDYGEIR